MSARSNAPLIFLFAISLGLLVAAGVLSRATPARAQVSESNCVSTSAVGSADATAHAIELSGPALCVTEVQIEDHGTNWRLTIVSNVEKDGPLWAVPHDNEDAAFTSGVYAVTRYGGTMVAVEQGERRLVNGLDPNRVFAITTSAARICQVTENPSPAYVDAFLAEWNRDYPIVGLHSNWDGYLDGDGLGTISVRRADAKMIPFPSVVAQGRFADEDTIAMLVSTRAPDANSDGQAGIDWLNERGVHVIYRHVTDANNECTLADYLTLNRLGPYFNLEVEHGDVPTQLGLVDLLMEFLASTAYRGML